jgi:hypothetical protein
MIHKARGYVLPGVAVVALTMLVLGFFESAFWYGLIL